MSQTVSIFCIEDRVNMFHWHFVPTYQTTRCHNSEVFTAAESSNLVQNERQHSTAKCRRSKSRWNRSDLWSSDMMKTLAVPGANWRPQLTGLNTHLWLEMDRGSRGSEYWCVDGGSILGRYKQSYIFFTVSRPSLGVQLVRSALFPGVKRLERETNHSSFSDSFKNTWKKLV